MRDGLILVTGATGYIASRLIPRLLSRGNPVRALARDVRRLDGRMWAGHVEPCEADVMVPSSLPSALDGVRTAYYLIHNMTFGRGYQARELEGARAFSSAAREAGVEHIIYLGGLADPQAHIAAHLRSRIETGRVLRQGDVPVTEFRAGAIIGSGSISFEMIRFITELFPILPGPRWLHHRSQPIAIDNVIDYLVCALDQKENGGRIFEIGGPEVSSYEDLILRYARIRGLTRRIFLLPYIPLWFMAWGVGKMTPVPRPIAYALIGGLANDSVVQDDSAGRVFPEVALINYEQAVGEALTHFHPDRIEPVWRAGLETEKSLKHEGFFINQNQTLLNTTHEKVFSVIENMGAENGWPYADWIWRLRGWMDKIISPQTREPYKASSGFAPASPIRGPNLAVGERLDFYRVEALDPDRMLLRSELKAPGRGWMGWQVLRNFTGPAGGSEQPSYGMRLIQTSYFAPWGLPGFLYWYLLYPFHAMVFRGLLRAIKRKAEG